MKHLLILTVGVCLLLTSVPAMADQAADEAAIRKATKGAMETVNKKDIEGHLEFYLHPYETFEGQRNREMHKAIHENQKDLRLKLLDDLSIVFVTPDVAIHKYRQEVSGSLDDAGNALPTAKRIVVKVYLKEKDKWLVTASYVAPIEE